MKSMLRNVTEGTKRYSALAFVCPGCLEFGGSGLHMLPVNTTIKAPAWDFDGNEEKPTISPSILTRYPVNGVNQICHSFLKEGVFKFLNDCTHSLAGKEIPIPDLPEWLTKEEE